MPAASARARNMAASGPLPAMTSLLESDARDAAKPSMRSSTPFALVSRERNSTYSSTSRPRLPTTSAVSVGSSEIYALLSIAGYEMPILARHCRANSVPCERSICSAASTISRLVKSETATHTSLAKYVDSTPAAAPKFPLSTHERTTLVMSDPTASATVVTSTERPVPAAMRTASAIAVSCGVRYNDIATVDVPSVNSSTRRPTIPAR